jgi:hypothetical protein
MLLITAVPEIRLGCRALLVCRKVPADAQREPVLTVFAKPEHVEAVGVRIRQIFTGPTAAAQQPTAATQRKRRAERWKRRDGKRDLETIASDVEREDMFAAVGEVAEHHTAPGPNQPTGQHQAAITPDRLGYLEPT